MKEIFIKKYWLEEDVLFYIHFKDSLAIRQIEITSGKRYFLSLENPTNNNSILYDQTLEELDLNENDFISEQEFNTIWEEQNND